MHPWLLYLGAIFSMGWGVAHLVPTRSVVAGFGEISKDNQRIITMEWIVEGVSLLYIGGVVLLVTLLDAASPVSFAIYLASVAVLIVLAGVSLATGFHINFLPYKLCPVIFSVSALLILIGAI